MWYLSRVGKLKLQLDQSKKQSNIRVPGTGLNESGDRAEM